MPSRLICLLLVGLAGMSQAESIPLPEPDAVFAEADPASVALGRLLFYDPILSGNRQVSCATCHHPRFGTSDGVSLSIGDGGLGLGPERVFDPENLPEQRIPRNAPALFNLGAAEFTVMFHDGRLELDPTKRSEMRAPQGQDTLQEFRRALAAQAMLPVLSADEMAGHYSENPISTAVRLGRLTGKNGAWDLLAARVRDIPAYRTAFVDLLGPEAVLEFTDIARTLADFIAHEWRADNSPFDQYLRGETMLSPEAMRGMALFYGPAQCASCHSGQFQTDHGFHAIAMPQLGPGKTARFEDHARDTGRLRVTGRAEDAFRFRTPSLRNVTLTAPYGHNGAYATLEGIVRHHLDPLNALHTYDRSQVVLTDLPGAEDWRILDTPKEQEAIAVANTLPRQSLSDAEIAALLAFLETLTDPVERNGVPKTVPSGLPVEQ